MDLEEKYRNYRKRQVELHMAILKGFVSADDYLKSAALLGILNSNNQVVIESKSEKDALYDFSIYGNIRAGSSALSVYIENISTGKFRGRRIIIGHEAIRCSTT